MFHSLMPEALVQTREELSRGNTDALKELLRCLRGTGIQIPLQSLEQEGRAKDWVYAVLSSATEASKFRALAQEHLPHFDELGQLGFRQDDFRCPIGARVLGEMRTGRPVQRILWYRWLRSDSSRHHVLTKLARQGRWSDFRWTLDRIGFWRNLLVASCQCRNIFQFGMTNPEVDFPRMVKEMLKLRRAGRPRLADFHLDEPSERHHPNLRMADMLEARTFRGCRRIVNDLKINFGSYEGALCMVDGKGDSGGERWDIEGARREIVRHDMLWKMLRHRKCWRLQNLN